MSVYDGFTTRSGIPERSVSKRQEEVTQKLAELRAQRDDLPEEFWLAYEREMRFYATCLDLGVKKMPPAERYYRAHYEGGLKQMRKDHPMVTAFFQAELKRLESLN